TIAQVTIGIRCSTFASDVFKNEAMFERMRRLRIADCRLRISDEVGSRAWIDVFAQLFADHANWRRAAARQAFDKLDAVVSIRTYRYGVVHSVAVVLALNTSRCTQIFH